MRPVDPRRPDLNRRRFLRGAGVALALPWLETLAPRRAGGAALSRTRFVATYFPCGVADFWRPAGTGAGAAWKLSPILAPLAPLKSRVSVLSNVGNYSPWGGHIEPSHGNLTGAFLTCVKASGLQNANRGISVDQVIARDLGSVTPAPSLQVGLSTLDSYPDGLPAQHSRSISWASASEPLYKLVDPQKVFDALFGAGMPPRTPDARAADGSMLDAVLSQAMSLQGALSKSDRGRLDQFLTSVREVERSIAGAGALTGCTNTARPAQSFDVGRTPPDYDRNAHADIMIDLVTLALQCDLTRVVSFMFDDSRSDFVYSFLTERQFTAAGSVPGTAPIGGLHGVSSAGNANNGWATINFWFVEKLARLCQKLLAVSDGPGGTILDQSVVWFGSEMHGGNHDGLDLPVLYVGSGGGRLKVDQHVDFIGRGRNGQDLANVYFTFLRKVFDLPETSFGAGVGDFVDAGHLVVPELVA